MEEIHSLNDLVGNMVDELPKNIKVAMGIAMIFSIIIGVVAVGISAYRQYILILRTFPPGATDVLVQVLPYLAPLCVEGFIIYSFIRLYFTTMNHNELTIIFIYGGAMVFVAIMSNIIESNISMGLALTDKNLDDMLRYVVPSVPVATGLAIAAMHLAGKSESVDSVRADIADEHNHQYVAELRRAARGSVKAAAVRKAREDAARLIGRINPSLPPTKQLASEVDHDRPLASAPTRNGASGETK